MYRVYIKKPSLILQDKQHDNDLNYEHTIQNDKLKKSYNILALLLSSHYHTYFSFFSTLILVFKIKIQVV